MGDKAPKGPLGLSGIIRLMHMAGASDEVTDNFLRLYQNEQSPTPLPPIVELGAVIAVAAKEAARVATYEWLSENGFPAKQPPGLAAQAQASGAAASGTRGKSTSHIYHLQIAGKKTSLSLPTALYAKSVDVLGPEVTDKLILELAAAPPPDVRRSAHVQQGLRKAVDRAQRAHRPAASVQ
ncbi:hypothetical protein [Ottowia sp.]|uniref:hypothetical protein n=1 Tax=Ottowia sp. TaxID=1898956 RepID=UPI0025EBD49F|nr:hypothetical protein [Ottowia sp.]MBK6616451.1 hypothetical protein [Ottowia sp.]